MGDQVESEVPTATLQIYNWIYENVAEREGNANRASSATNCVRQSWYYNHDYPSNKLTPRKIVNFLAGDIGELTMKYFISQGCVGDGKLYSEVNFGELKGYYKIGKYFLPHFEQPPWSFNVQDITITGHPDGVGKRNSDGKWELIECKTASNYGYEGFKKEGAKDYLKQAHALMLTDEAARLGLSGVRFFYLRKETGHIWDRFHAYDMEIAAAVASNFVKSNMAEIPKRDFESIDEMKIKQKDGVKFKEPTGRKTVEWQCEYCSFLKECHGDYEVEWPKDRFGNAKPYYILKENVNERKQNGS